jgi:hypothetical protein
MPVPCYRFYDALGLLMKMVMYLKIYVLVNMIKIYVILDLWITSIISKNDFKSLHKLNLLDGMNPPYVES